MYCRIFSLSALSTSASASEGEPGREDGTSSTRARPIWARESRFRYAFGVKVECGLWCPAMYEEEDDELDVDDEVGGVGLNTGVYNVFPLVLVIDITDKMSVKVLVS